MSDDYTRHEAMHMTSYFCGVIDQELSENEYIIKNLEFKNDVDKVVGILALLYQKIGKEHLGDDFSKELQPDDIDDKLDAACAYTGDTEGCDVCQ